jgi:hypothetical protein
LPVYSSIGCTYLIMPVFATTLDTNTTAFAFVFPPTIISSTEKVPLTFDTVK